MDLKPLGPKMAAELLRLKDGLKRPLVEDFDEKHEAAELLRLKDGLKHTKPGISTSAGAWLLSYSD